MASKGDEHVRPGPGLVMNYEYLVYIGVITIEMHTKYTYTHTRVARNELINQVNAAPTTGSY